MEGEIGRLLELIGDNGWALVAVLLPIAYVFGLPLLNWFTFRTEARPSFVRVWEGSAFPEEAGQHLDIARAHFLPLGFEELDTLYLPHQMDNVKTILRLFVNRVEQDSAIAVIIYGLVGDRWRLRTKYVEICSRFRDGSEVDTRNAKEIGAFPVPASKTVVAAPWLAEIPGLYRAHQAVSQLVASGKVKELQLDREFQGDVPAYLTAGMIDDYRDAQAAGYLRRTGGEETVTGSETDDDNPFRSPGWSTESAYYVATIKGAYLMTWNELWPLKGWIRRWHYRRARRLLVEAGFTR